MANPPPGLPTSGESTLPFWRTDLHELDDIRSTERLPAECDVVIVGAGYAGVTTAYRLLGHESPPSVVMLEARQVCSGATARNGGHVKPDVYFNILNYTKRYGAEAAAAVASFEAANVYAVKELVEREGIDCDFTLTRAIDVYLDPDHAKATEEAYRELLRIGAADLKDIQMLKGKDAETISGVKGAKTCFSFTAAHLWPYKLVLGLLSRLVERGLNVQTRTPVHSVSETPGSSGKWTVVTPRGPILATRVVFATNGYTAAIAPQFENKIIPVRGICSRIVAPRGTQTQRLTNTYSIRYRGAISDYMIVRLDGSIIIGGGKERFWDDRSQWYNVTDDTELIEPARTYFDDVIRRNFKGWEDSGAYTDKLWTGIQGWTTDKMPYIGAVPEKPGQFVFAGFNGHGMPIICLASVSLAEMVMGKDFEDTGLPKLFKPTMERLQSRRNEILGTED
ncbi:FAD dependent oxidoreductase superfamily protein [Thozetella sp. PMI_491]|nr:FAD dependent oxidoreductase superfamily protein [Thozetella sp. PMI_491]